MAWDPLCPWPRGRAWVWIALGTLALFAQGPSFLRSLRPARSQGVDFFQEWASARFVLDGTPAYQSQDLALVRYLGLERDPHDPQFISHNAHPPSSILLALPLASLDYPDATLAWNLVSLALIVAGIAIVARELEIQPAAWSIFPVLALGLTCNPLRQTLNQGQLNGVLLFLLVAAWSADRRGRQEQAGLLVALAAAIKLFPAFLLGHFLLRRRWRALGTSLFTLAAVTVLTGEVIGWPACRAYASEILPKVARFQSDWPNGSLTGFWTKLIGTGANHFGHEVRPLASVPWLARVATLASVAAVLSCCAKTVASATTRRGQDRAFALSLTAMLLLSPICWDHYLLLLVLPLSLIWKSLSFGRGSRVLFTLVILGIWVNPLQVWALGLPDPATLHTWSISAPTALVTLLSYPSYLLLILFAWLIRLQPQSAVAGTEERETGRGEREAQASRLRTRDDSRILNVYGPGRRDPPAQPTTFPGHLESESQPPVDPCRDALYKSPLLAGMAT
jgi:hypothetical protein